MKRKTLVILALVIIALGISAWLILDNQSDFSGVRVRNPDCYTLQFTEMNEQDSHTLALRAGDRLSIDFAVDRGRVDLVIGIPSEKPIYRGDNINSGVFELTAPEDGEYRIDVTARHAAGFVTIYARAGEN